jgi:hypothetical protein
MQFMIPLFVGEGSHDSLTGDDQTADNLQQRPLLHGFFGDGT